MKVCQAALQELVVLGLGPYNPNKKSHYNVLIFLYILLCALTFGLTGAYLFLDAKTFDEITQCIYIISTSILSAVNVGSLALQQKKLFGQIVRAEAIINLSK